MTGPGPRICCLDLDTFFVSVERLLDPTLEGKPVIVGGRPGSRGVVTACSYEVRRFGVHSGMSLTEASKLAPNAIYLPTRGGTYSTYSEAVLRLAERYSPIVRAASVDEMYIDFAGCERMYRAAEDESDDATILRVVRGVTAAIKEEIGLPSSAGIGTTKRMAKVACGLAKPAGVLLVPAGREAEVLAPLPVRKLPGIGPVAERMLAELGITTLGEIARTADDVLRPVFGAWTDDVVRASAGLGPSDLGRHRPAFREHDPDGETVGSISNERTFREDIRDPGIIESMLCSLCERVCWRARKRGVKARTVTLKLRYADFETLTRSMTFSPTHSELELFPIVLDVYRKARRRSTRVRLLGVALSNLGFFDEQLGLFPDKERLHETVDAIREKFGYEALRVAGSTSSKGTESRSNDDDRT